MGEVELYTKAFKVVTRCHTLEQATGASRYLAYVHRTQILPEHLHERLVNYLIDQIDKITSES